MAKQVLVIGGTRYFGKLLVERLLAEGHSVTIATRGRAPDTFGTRVRRIRVDRRNKDEMLTAFAGISGYDLLYDQMCYSPLDAEISVRTFQGKVSRYVMSSTIEVYAHLIGKRLSPFSEDNLSLDKEIIDRDYPWHDPDKADDSYAAGKRQAEAYFYRDGTLPIVSVRIGHVLGGPEDFTGRLLSYVTQVAEDLPLFYSNEAGRSSFTDGHGITDFLHWVGDQSFKGPINAAFHENFSALDLYRRAGLILEKSITPKLDRRPVKPSEISPFDYPAPYIMSAQRALSHGYQYSPDPAWLDALIKQHAIALTQQ